MRAGHFFTSQIFNELMTQSHIILLVSLVLVFVIVVGTTAWLFRSVFRSNSQTGITKALGEILTETTNGVGVVFLFLLRMIRFVLVMVFRIVASVIGGLGPRKKNDDPYSGRFLGPWAKLWLYNGWNKGLWLSGTADRLTRSQSFRHVLVVGNSGSGKSTVITFPNVIRETKSSLVVFDPSGEVYAKTAGLKQRQGYTVKVINPTSDETLTYNPLANATDGSGIARVASTLVAQTLGSGGKEGAFWNTGAIGILRVMCHVLRTCGSQFYTLLNVKHALENLAADPQSVSHWVAEHSPNDQVWTEFLAFMNQPDNIWKGMLSTAIKSLEPLGDERLAAVTSSNTIDLAGIRSEKSILYICVPEHKIGQYKFLVSLLYGDLFNRLMEPPKPDQAYHDVLVLADEFANTGKIQGFEVFLTCLRKRNVSLCLMIQSSKQLAAVYGPDISEVIMDNTATKVYLPGLSHRMTASVSQSLGRRGVANDRGSISSSTELLSADELRCLHDDEALVMIGNKRPWIAKMHRYYKNYFLRRKTRYTAELEFPHLDTAPPLVTIPKVDEVEIDLPQTA